MKKEFVVIGLGRFGGSIVRELIELEADVMAIDISQERVEEYANIATQAVAVDTTDEAALRSLGIRNFEHVVIAIGENIQSSILTTLILKEIGVQRITVKAQNDYHEKVLRKIGADQVVHPERDMGKRIANNLVSNNILDYLELSDEYSIVEIQANNYIAGSSLIDLDIRAKYGVNIVAIKRGTHILVSPQAIEQIEVNDVLIVIGSDLDIHRFERKALH
ncbi:MULTISPECIES: potassium channel family protein [Sporosarcina]|uniref:potassium channel family protein n=1 Tax=Sporosarcina TaxID=1569 RepID=UPI00129A9390|nr:MULTISPECIES: TrkA family potassium uptake protein [Sporosarcina]GKV66046.1 ktr system potassium uptake protein C [Sporosarcina sp. NCCP-2331]GLB56528.1 ktr system potassium uptake protein C [Sporosarcina sp. NCCP-2378]